MNRHNDAGDGRLEATAAGQILAFLLLLIVVLALGGCGTVDCARLAEKAERAGCPERIVTETVEVFEPIDLGEIPEPPPLTAAELGDDTGHELELEAILTDLAASRSWGFTLYDKLRAYEAAVAAIAGDGPPAPDPEGE
jgi:hypothetical protein